MNAKQEYRPAYQLSLVDPSEFWRDAAESISWEVPPTQILDTAARPTARWFPDARLNTSYNALDRHVREITTTDGPTGGKMWFRADQQALKYDTAMT